MATIRIYFSESSPAPTNGYLVRYRKSGTTAYSTVTPNPTSSPALILGADGTASYEGTIQSDCGTGVYSTPSVFQVDPCTGPDKKVIGENCETGERENFLSTDNGNGTYTCSYWYRFPDGSKSDTYTELNNAPCAL